jgi:osmotically-inducible protein OsmY
LQLYTQMKTDLNIKLQIKKAIESNSSLDAAGIDIAVQNGDVSLSGQVDKFCKKEIVKKLAKDVEGVTAVTETIVVTLDEKDKVNDNELSTIIEGLFAKNFSNAHKDIKVIVKDGYVWLEGHLKWKYQKDLAQECIACIDGIKWIENNILIPDPTAPIIDEKDVLASIYGDYSITTDIKVEVLGNRVILKGTVESINKKNLVTRLVRAVPGVKEIENFLSVDWRN